MLVATRRGLWRLSGDTARRAWTLAGPAFLGHDIHHAIADPREPRTWLVTARTGHLGPTIFRSTDRGRRWSEASRPPAFRPGSGRSVEHTAWLAPGHASQPGTWFAGTSPHGLFRSEDGGATWSALDGFNDHQQRRAWMLQEPPASPRASVHFIAVDPRDPARLLIAMSPGGVFESTTAGRQWQPLNRGVPVDYPPAPFPAHGQEPGCVRVAADPDRLYQQDRLGIFRLDRPDDAWTGIGAGMPKSVGATGMALATHPEDPDTLWVFPLDTSGVRPWVAPGGRPAAYRSVDGGRSWRRQAEGFPSSQAWWTVPRNAMTTDRRAPAGVYVGTTSGEVWGSRDEGRSWRCLARHLPEIRSLEIA